MPTTATDPRLAAMIEIRDTDPRGKCNAVTMWPGSTGSPLHQLTLSEKALGEKALDAAYQARTNRNLSPSELGQRLHEAGDAALKEAGPLAAKVSAERTRIAAAMAALSPVKSHAESAGPTVLYDFKRAERFDAMPVHDREAIAHEVSLNPLAHLDFAEASLRLPADLSPLRHKERAMVRHELLKRFRSDEYAVLDVQAQQLQATEQVMHAVLNVIRTTTDRLPDPLQSPEAFGYMNGAPAPLGWQPASDS